MELSVSRQTSAGPAEVWELATDLERSPQVLSGVTRVERLDDGDGFGPGTRWRETREIQGKEYSEELTVTAVDEGRSYTVEADSHGVHYRSVFTVEPEGDGARITMRFGADQRRGRLGALMARTFGKAVEAATRTALQQDVDDLAAAAEATTPGTA